MQEISQVFFRVENKIPWLSPDRIAEYGCQMAGAVETTSQEWIMEAGRSYLLGYQDGSKELW